MIENRFLVPGDVLEHGQTVVAAHRTTVALGSTLDDVCVDVVRVVLELGGQRWTENRPPHGRTVVADVNATIRDRYMAAR